jgi:hypothetical protein
MLPAVEEKCRIGAQVERVVSKAEEGAVQTRGLRHALLIVTPAGEGSGAKEVLALLVTGLS